MIKSNKGYSLIEIGVGILILTVFLLVSLGMFNGAYNNYRRIKQRNIAMDTAIKQIENMLQMNKDELTGFFEQKVDPVTGIYDLEPSDRLIEFVKDMYDNYYGYYPDDEEVIEYINDHTSECVNEYIRWSVRQSENPPTPEELANGEYGFIVNGQDSNKNEVVLYNVPAQVDENGNEYVISNNQPVKIVRSVRRLPATSTSVFGNELLRIRVEIFYSDKFGNHLNDDDLNSVYVETIKITNNTDKDDYVTSIIVMTDGRANVGTFNDLRNEYLIMTIRDDEED